MRYYIHHSSSIPPPLGGRIEGYSHLPFFSLSLASVQGAEEFIIRQVVEAGNVCHQRLHCILTGTESQGQQEPVERQKVVQFPLFSFSTTDWRIPALWRKKAAIL